MKIEKLEMDVDTLHARLTAEQERANATFIGQMMFGAIGQKT